MIEIPIEALLKCIVYGGLLITALTYFTIITFAALND